MIANRITKTSELDLSDDPRRQHALNPPKFRGAMHAVAAPISIIAGIALLIAAPSWSARIPLAFFAGSVSLMLTTSATFHRGTWTDAQWWRMRQLDMTGIYLLIAGEYTGIAGVVIEDPWRTRLMIAVWVGALVGIAIRWLPIVPPFGLATTIYIIVGSTVLLAIDELYHGLGALGFTLLMSGCALYLFGSFMLGVRRPNPWPGVFGYHEVWHTFVTLAVVLHYICVIVAVFPKL